MERSPAATEEDIFNACERLKSKGEKVTVLSVIEENGSGSASTVAPMVKRWKELDAAKTQSDLNELPVALVTAMKAIVVLANTEAEEKIALTHDECEAKITEAKEICEEKIKQASEKNAAEIEKYREMNTNSANFARSMQDKNQILNEQLKKSQADIDKIEAQRESFRESSIKFEAEHKYLLKRVAGELEPEIKALQAQSAKNNDEIFEIKHAYEAEKNKHVKEKDALDAMLEDRKKKYDEAVLEKNKTDTRNKELNAQIKRNLEQLERLLDLHNETDKKNKNLEATLEVERNKHEALMEKLSTRSGHDSCKKRREIF